MNTFEITTDQFKKLDEWIRSKIKKDDYVGAIGGRFTYSFTPTSIGVVIKVRDDFDKTELDLTDYDGW